MLEAIPGPGNGPPTSKPLHGTARCLTGKATNRSPCRRGERPAIRPRLRQLRGCPAPRRPRSRRRARAYRQQRRTSFSSIIQRPQRCRHPELLCTGKGPTADEATSQSQYCWCLHPDGAGEPTDRFAAAAGDTLHDDCGRSPTQSRSACPLSEADALPPWTDRSRRKWTASPRHRASGFAENSALHVGAKRTTT